MTPYPLYYCPQGVARPLCCPHVGAVGALPGKGPDTVRTPEGQAIGGDGLCWGGPLPAPGTAVWTKAPAGWYVLLDGMTPQALRRSITHPRVLRWRTVRGISPDHRWRVPVLLTRDEEGDPLLAIDRVLTPDGWQAGDDLTPLLEPLQAVAAGRRLHEDPTERNEACIALAIDLLAIGQWLDRDLAAVTGWISEAVVIRVLRAALDHPDDDAREADL